MERRKNIWAFRWKNAVYLTASTTTVSYNTASVFVFYAKKYISKTLSTVTMCVFEFVVINFWQWAAPLMDVLVNSNNVEDAWKDLSIDGNIVGNRHIHLHA